MGVLSQSDSLGCNTLRLVGRDPDQYGNVGGRLFTDVFGILYCPTDELDMSVEAFLNLSHTRIKGMSLFRCRPSVCKGHVLPMDDRRLSNAMLPNSLTNGHARQHISNNLRPFLFRVLRHTIATVIAYRVAAVNLLRFSRNSRDSLLADMEPLCYDGYVERD